MRIPCPFCGERELVEFTYLGAANDLRPDASEPGASERFFEAVYVRENPRGPHEELWYHTHGCRRWLRVRRDTLTHQVFGATLMERSERR